MYTHKFFTLSGELQVYRTPPQAQGKIPRCWAGSSTGRNNTTLHYYVNKVSYKTTQSSIPLLQTHIWVCIYAEYKRSQKTDLKVTCASVAECQLKSTSFLSHFCSVWIFTMITFIITYKKRLITFFNMENTQDALVVEKIRLYYLIQPIDRKQN